MTFLFTPHPSISLNEASCTIHGLDIKFKPRKIEIKDTIIKKGITFP